MSQFSLFSPKNSFANKANLSISNISSSEESEEEHVVQEIGKLKKEIATDKKEKKKLDLRVEGLEHDIKCAEEAQEMGRRNAINLAKKLTQIFGTNFKDEDLIAKISELTARRDKADAEILSLKSELNRIQNESPKKMRANAASISHLNNEIKDVEKSTEKAATDLKAVQDLIQTKKEELRAIQDEMNDINNKFSKEFGTEWTPNEVCNKIEQYSDKAAFEACSQMANQFGIKKSSVVSISSFIKELISKINQINEDIGENGIKSIKFANLQKETKDVMKTYNLIRDENKKLKNQKLLIISQIDNIKTEQNFDNIDKEFDYLLEKEKEIQKRRVKELQNNLQISLRSVNYQWPKPKSRRETLSMISSFISMAQSEITTLSKQKIPNPNLYILNNKIAAVRKQNKKIRHKIEKFCDPMD